MAIITLVGGTVGGYISFAGAHRLLDAGLGGKENTKEVGRLQFLLYDCINHAHTFISCSIGCGVKGYH